LTLEEMQDMNDDDWKALEAEFDRLAHFLSVYVATSLEAVGSKVATPGVKPTDLELMALTEDLERAQRDIKAVQGRVWKMLYERRT